MITLTPRAAKQVQSMHAELNAPSKRLRVLVESGGCSGFQYHFTLDDAHTPDDQIFEKNGVCVVIDSTSLGLLSNAIIDYTQDLTSSQFVIKNPNASTSCGCGNSFSI